MSLIKIKFYFFWSNQVGGVSSFGPQCGFSFGRKTSGYRRALLHGKDVCDRKLFGGKLVSVFDA